jgi:uncharacterized protein
MVWFAHKNKKHHDMKARMRKTSLLTYWAGVLISQSRAADCPDYSSYSTQIHQPVSSGKYSLSYMRPSPECRTFQLPSLEKALNDTKAQIKDPDLSRLFENTWPNTLDTAIKWHGVAANNTDEELTFVITGDINAMWLRDSANQLQSYLPILESSDVYGKSNNSLGSLFRGVINLQSRYLLTSPFCNSFQPPVESNIPPSDNGAASNDAVLPAYNNESVFECKYELDSLAAFLQISSDYFGTTNDTTFFGRFQWRDAVLAVLNTAEAMLESPTYAPNGSVNNSPYRFTRDTTRATETLANDGLGNPVNNGTGLIRSAFRPSDDATIYQFLIPANMMFAVYSSKCASIANALGDSALASRLQSLSSTVRAGIESHGVINHPTAGKIYAYEVDGYGSANIMDDANVPSLLSANSGKLGYVDANNSVYQSTRSAVLSPNTNPYFMHGPVLSAVGGPHIGPGYAWPMAAIIRILTSSGEGRKDEIVQQLNMILSSTSGLGLIHESVSTFSANAWTRQWFSWANGLFGAMIVGLAQDEDEAIRGILGMSFQQSILADTQMECTDRRSCERG